MVTHADEAPAFVLANEGYDVWMGNSRGTIPSRRHMKYDPDGRHKALYWDFSWAEMGKYDILASLKKVKNITGVEKVTFIGHSMGNTQLFYALSHDLTRNYLKKDINLFIALAPVTQIKHHDSVLLWTLSWV